MNLKKLQKTIEQIGEGLDSKDDWMPHLIMEKKGQATICAFDPQFFQNQQSKDGCAEGITKAISVFKPDCVCFITTAWTLDFEKEKMSELDSQLYIDGNLKLSEHPKRVECVTALCYGERGESEGEALMMGFIERSPDKHPRIRRWKIMQTAEGEYGGRFPDAIHEGFKLARTKKGETQT